MFALNDEPEVSGLPLIGRVAAGEPILAQEHVECHYKVDPELFKPSADFLLRGEWHEYEGHRYYGW